MLENRERVQKCFQTLRESIEPEDKEYSTKLCCNVSEYEKCIFPFIIYHCGMKTLDKFEAEMSSLNKLCSMTTLNWNKCQKNETIPDLENELKE